MPDRNTDRGTCWLEINLSALRSNFHAVQNHLEGKPPVLTVVKANAYGHGAVPVSKALLEEGASILGVATADEARELREGGIEGRILILGRMVQADIPAALRWHTEITLQHPEMARWGGEDMTGDSDLSGIWSNWNLGDKHLVEAGLIYFLDDICTDPDYCWEAYQEKRKTLTAQYAFNDQGDEGLFAGLGVNGDDIDVTALPVFQSDAGAGVYYIKLDSIFFFKHRL